LDYFLFLFFSSDQVGMYEQLFEFMIQNELISQEELLAKPPSRWDLRAIYRIEKLKKFETSGGDDSRQLIRQKTSVSITSARSVDDANISDAKYVSNELEEIYKIILPSNVLKSQESSSQFMRAGSDVLVSMEKRLLYFYIFFFFFLFNLIICVCD